MGGFCGYLTSMSALASGSDIAYIHEDPFAMKEIMHDLTVLKEKISEVFISLISFSFHILKYF